MAVTRSSRPFASPAAKEGGPRAANAFSCRKMFEFFKDVTIRPGESHDSTVPKDIDCYQWLHVWVVAEHRSNVAMDNITVELVFELTDKMDATGLANLETPYAVNVRPTPLQVNSGTPFGGHRRFVIRAPIIGPGVRVIVVNGGAETYSFTVRGYCTR